jgi:hypothetical protein
MMTTSPAGYPGISEGIGEKVNVKVRNASGYLSLLFLLPRVH